MKHSTRRDFIQTSATAAAALALNPTAALARDATMRSEGIPGALPNERVRARPVPLAKVRLTGGPLKRAQDAAAGYLLSLDPDRMMAFYRIRADLTPKKGAQPYGGWDGPGRNLTGHVTGHHLS